MSGERSEPRARRLPRRRFIAALLLTLLLPVWYALSLGPLAWLYHVQGFPYFHDAVRMYAAPQELLYRSETLARWMDAYMRLWGP